MIGLDILFTEVELFSKHLIISYFEKIFSINLSEDFLLINSVKETRKGTLTISFSTKNDENRDLTITFSKDEIINFIEQKNNKNN